MRASLNARLSSPRVQDGIQQVFDEASSYYRDLRWEKNRLTRFEKLLTLRTLEEELGAPGVEAALELGCGPGTWTPLLAGRARRVTAVDLSEGMLTQAREAVSSSNVDFVHADASRFQAETPYDLAMSVRVLEYVPEWDTIIGRLRHLVRPGGRAVVITKTPVSVYRGTGRERWFGPRTLPRLLAGRQLDPNFWQRHIPVRKMAAGFWDAGFTGIKVRPVIFGLPIFMRGTKQYPIVPSFAERPFLWSFEQAWRWASAGGETRRLLSLVFSESYAVSGLRSES